MHFIDQLSLTLHTLFGASLFPLFYVVFHIRYWWHFKKLKALDFALLCFSAIALSIVLVNLVKNQGYLSRTQKEIALMHFIPLITTILLVVNGKRLIPLAAVQREAVPNRAPESENKTEYKPTAFHGENQPVSWDEVIVSEDLKAELQAVAHLLSDPKTTAKYGIEVPKGILLSGPPGTGKTTIARALASTSGLTFFVLRLDDVISKWVGDSEKNISALFRAARQAAPAMIFIDEVDAIGRQRSADASGWSQNVLNHLLQEMDGISADSGVYIIAATNREDVVDEALKRAGRLTKTIFVPKPELASRVKLFELYLRKLHLTDDSNIHHLAQLTEGKTGADIKEICNQAGLNAYKRESALRGKRDYLVTQNDLAQAILTFADQSKSPKRA